MVFLVASAGEACGGVREAHGTLAAAGGRVRAAHQRVVCQADRCAARTLPAAGREGGGRYPATEQRTHAMADPKKEPQPKRRVQKTTRSPAQREASRKNGACSRGPKSPETKKRSSLNSLKCGFYAESDVIPGESIEE
jgi:hypothetical protein